MNADCSDPYIYIYIYIYIHARTYMALHVPTHARTCVYMYIYIYICIRHPMRLGFERAPISEKGLEFSALRNTDLEKE